MTVEKAAEWVNPKDLKMWKRNPRKNDPAVKRVADSIKRFGFGAPVVARKGGDIIAGHTRVKAAIALKLDRIPVRYLDIDEREAHLLALADNRLTEIAEWDTPELLSILGDYSLEDADLAGWTKDDLDKIGAELAGGTDIEEDEAPEPPKDPITKPGDIWVMERHRLLCGDSTVEADVARLMEGNRATCIFTDPPYGVSIAEKNKLLNTVQPSGRCLEAIEADALPPEELKEELLRAFVILRTTVMAEDCSVFVTSPQGCGLSMMMMMMMQEAGLRARHVLIWKKNQPTFSMGRLDYDYQHEPILFTWLKRHKRPMGGKFKTSIWEINKPRASPDHPTMKPVELYSNAYLNNSDDGDYVADIYAGSGPAFSAAHQLNRRCYGIEISPAYCDVIVERWENLSGGKAVKLSQ